MQKLELKYLAAYLPYNLKVQGQTHKEIFELCGIDGSVALLLENGKVDFFDIKPILRPLSDLTKEIEVNGEKFVPEIKLEEIISCRENWCDAYEDAYDIIITVNNTLKEKVLMLPYEFIEILLYWHFDVFGLIEHNLAIDINTLNK